jgi:hypothetical protein
LRFLFALCLHQQYRAVPKVRRSRRDPMPIPVASCAELTLTRLNPLEFWEMDLSWL